MKRNLLILIAACSVVAGSAQRRVECSSADDIVRAVAQARGSVGADTLFVHIKPGTYCLQEPLVITGEQSCPIVFEGDANDKPLLSAGKRIGGWVKTKEGWWQTHVTETVRYGWRPEQLYVNGRRATRARTPDRGFYTVSAVKEDVHHHGGGRSPLYATQAVETEPALLAPLKGLAQPELEQVVARFYHKWDNTTKYLQYALPDSGRFYITGHGMTPWNDLRQGTQYCLENYRGALNAPGEWFLALDGTLTYIPLPGEDIATAEVFAPVLEQVLILRGTPDRPVEDKIFRNLRLHHTANYTPRNGTEPSQVACQLEAAVMMDHARRIALEDCEIEHTGNYAVWVRRQCHECRVQGCFIHDIGGGGVKLGDFWLPDEGDDVTGENLVENCILRHLGLTYPCSGGVVIFHSWGNRVLHNDICDLRYTGVSVGWVWGYTRSPSHDNEVGFNHIHHIGWGELSDMGAVYTLGLSPGTRIHDNVVHDVWSYDYGGWGLYTDEGSSGIVLENNLVYNTKCGGFHQHYGRENVVRNNIFAWAWLQQLQASRKEDHRSFTFEHNIVIFDRGELLAGQWGQFLMDHNLYYDASGRPLSFLGASLDEWHSQGHDQHSLVRDPLFRDARHYDFRLRSEKAVRRIGFRPFDYSRAGVEGPDEWKQRAMMPQALVDEFARLYK